MDVDDSDSEYEVEESVVLVELNGIIDANFLLQEQTPTKILGIDTDQPILQIGHYIFSGEYENTMGTVVLYQPTDSSKTDASGKDYEYLCKTDKKLTMKRIFIKEKTNDNTTAGEEVSCTNPIPNGESTASPITSNKTLDHTNNHNEGIPPDETHSEAMTIENDIRSISTNSEENLQNANIVDHTSSIEKEISQDTNALPSKEKDPKSLDIPEKPLSPKNKDRKRKLDDRDSQPNNAEAESVKEDVEPVPCSSGKQLKLDVEDSDMQDKVERHLEKKVKCDSKETDETDINSEQEPLVQDKNESNIPETDKSSLQKNANIVQNKDNLSLQNKKSVEQKEGKSTVQEKDKSRIKIKELSSVLKKSKSLDKHKETTSVENKKSNVHKRKKSSIQKEENSSSKDKGKSSGKSNVQEKKTTLEEKKSGVHRLKKTNVQEKGNSSAEKDNSSVQEKVNSESEEIESMQTQNQNPSIASTSKTTLGKELKVTTKSKTDTDNNIPENKDIGIGVEAINIDENEASLISNSENVNQLVESSTDKMLFLDNNSNVDEVRGDGNCSSSGDLIATNNSTVSSDVCQSSDSKRISKILRETIEKFDFSGASSSTTSQQGQQARLDQEDSRENIPHSKSVQTDISKPTNCEVSQSLNDEVQEQQYSEAKDSNECQTSVPLPSPQNQSSNERDIDNAGEGSSSAVNLSVPFQSGTDETDRSTKRKLSSCEVTQSSNSEKEFSETPEEVSECEVFSQNPLPDIESMFNRSTNNVVEPFDLTAGSSDEVEPSRLSLASESSTSEVSQSHKSVIQESKSVEEENLEDSPFEDGGECSQSSDQVHDTLNNTSLENNKDLCVSSCDVTKDTSVSDESLELDKNIRNTGCEVSQSDRLGASTSSSNMIVEELLSNECDAPTTALEGHQNINQYGIGTLHPSSEVTNTGITSGKQMACEVSQSFSSTNQPSVSRMNLQAGSSNECSDYTSSCPGSVSNDDSNNNCVSSDDVSHFSSPLGEDAEEQVKDSSCEVSQSSRSGKNLSPDEPCGSSYLGGQRNLNTDKLKSKNSCEVSQSLEHESSSVSELYEDDDDSINECERSNSNVDIVDQSDDNIEEICESSDDVIVVSNDDSNSQSEQVRPINYSGCEVSQSYRLEDGALIALSEQFFVGVESSNECEAYGSSVSSAPEYNISHSDSEEKNICESSDDIERSSGDVKSSSQKSKNDSQEACQSTKSDDNFTCDTARVDLVEDNSNAYNPRNFSDDGTNVCESSEDINVTDNSPETNSDACSSSDKLFKKPAENNKQCDSFSNQAIAGPSTQVSERITEHSQISQSENESTTHLVSSNSQSDAVKVSSSVDSIGSNYVDMIYSSSSVSNSTSSSNAEVSQSSARKGPYVWSGNLLSAASSSNSSIITGHDNVSSDEPIEASFSGDINVQSSANNPILESTDSAIPSDTSMSSSRNNDVIESSISSSLASGNRIKKHILKKTNELSGEQSTSSKEQKRESVILGGNYSSNPNISDNSSLQNQPEVDSMSQQFPFQLGNISQFERSTDAVPRPSLLEVMVSSASDFRNSLLYDSSSFSKETNNSSVVESSSNNIRPPDEFSESFIGNVSGGSSEASGVASPSAIVPQSFLVENSDSARIEVTGSLEGVTHNSSNESNTRRNQVSQSSDIVNTHSSTSHVPALVSDGISESIHPDPVQSSSQVLKTSHISHEADSNKASGSGMSFILSESSKKEVPESSSTQSSMLTDSANLSVSSEKSVQTIESSSDLPLSFHCSGNVDGEVSSMPPIIDPVVPLMDGSEQCSVIEGNLVLLSESGSILNRPEGNLTQVGIISAQGGFVPFQSERQLLLQTSNEADILNSGSAFSSNIQLPIQGTMGNVSNPEIQSLATTQGDGRSSEVSESLSAEQNERSMLADNNVSCSVVEFSTIDKKYSFSKGEYSGNSREAESKSDDDISSFQSVCNDNILPVQNLPSSENPELSMYSHIGEFEDSIQSSSLDATHFSINEQIRAISSPPTFSNSDSSGEQTPSSINAFVSFSSESHDLPSMQYSLPSISSIPTSFIAGDISSRLHPGEFLDGKSGASGITDANTVTRQSPNTTYFQESIIGNEASGSNEIGDDNEESSRMSDLIDTENSPEEYEVLSEYEEMDNVDDDSNLVDSSND